MTAFLIPENLCSRDSVPSSLRKVAAALRDSLPHEVTVWLEGEEEADPYLVVLDPQAGILVLDAADDTGLRRALARWSNKRISSALALVSARRRTYVQEIKRRASRERILQGDLPIAVALAAPLFDRTALARRFANLLDGSPSILTAEDLTPESLRGAIQRAIGGAKPLAGNEEAAARAILHPEIVIRRPNEDAAQIVFRPPTSGDDDVIRVLDREQERLARRLDGGYRVIRGVAGSGKTLVLTYRAKFLAKKRPDWKILLTCFNVCFAKALEHELRLRSLVGAVPNVEVRHIDSVAVRILKSAKIRVGKAESADDWLEIRELALDLLREQRELAEYDAVLVDEAQDFDGTTLDLAYHLIKDGADHFVIALDTAQDIYRRSTKWNPPGLTARGRTTVLRQSYRSTKEILEFAWRFLTGSNSVRKSGRAQVAAWGTEAELVVPKAGKRRGLPPEVISCRTWQDEARAIVDRIVQLHKEGVPWGAMAIILGNSKMQRQFYWETKGKDVPYFWVPWKPSTKRQVAERTDAVRAFTIQAAKGLEFGCVFFAGVNDIYDPGAELDPAGRRKLAYVAMTRATDRLFVTVSGTGEIGQAILEARGK